MNSIASGHYPRRVRQGGHILLWNPVTRRALKDRPEERVRLRVVEYLLAGEWPRTRISTEEGRSGAGGERLRTDILCYNSRFEPELLVECKAESVRIDENTSLQTARYNRRVGARWLLMTNGLSDYWYESSGKGRRPDPLDSPPEPLASAPSPAARKEEYWTERGFLGRETPPPLARTVTQMLNRHWTGNGEVRYLNFQNSPTGYPLDQYYLIGQCGELRLALAPLPAAGGGTRLVIVVSRESVNEAVIEIHPRPGEPEEESAVRLLTSAGEQRLTSGELTLGGSGNGDPLPDDWAASAAAVFRDRAEK